MILIILILIVFIMILLSYLIFMKIQIRNIKKQLDDYNSGKLHKKLDIVLLDRDIEGLACSINKHIDINIKTQVNQKNSEAEIKKTIASISHDLRTPLTSVIGYIQMIISNELSLKKQNEYMHIALKRAKSLQALLNDFFQLSIIESHEYKIQNKSININNILCEVITDFYDSFLQKKITPNIDIKEENIIVIGNEVCIKRVIENLINNVIKHARNYVFIELKKDCNEAVLTIINEANGIKENDAKLIFNRFYKGNSSRTVGNTGLGLSIVKNLMEKMNGHIYAKINKNLLYIFCKWKIEE
ncbi:sensor histidine kinase [Clostridium tyrobutyricum]|nr:HAMP domain-containing sensor histidine kinase [Clostridium tyrobutyricum]ANP69293.1 two-component sensor histidine kinase [Clostridium tyrobutyricum]MBV4435306.1 HAMP domain-containing histidine kinase [Clostridium tyrobutyricum]MBV4437813.1 HAMP domain-containing histidine kinase [Clostridium tyrobutyricum]MBV4441025.1 HAMP domain-containing histidine kinase [Clostridium tyrobutyricum]